MRPSSTPNTIATPKHIKNGNRYLPPNGLTNSNSSFFLDMLSNNITNNKIPAPAPAKPLANLTNKKIHFCIILYFRFEDLITLPPKYCYNSKNTRLVGIAIIFSQAHPCQREMPPPGVITSGDRHAKGSLSLFAAINIVCIFMR